MVLISAHKIKEEALISKALLEAAGVPVTLIDECGELQLHVREPDARFAQEILLADDSPEWRHRGMKWNRFHGVRDGGTGKHFVKGGAGLMAAILLLLLLLLPFGVSIRITPFVLVTLFVAGGCGFVVKRTFKIKRKTMGRGSSPGYSPDEGV